MKKSILPLSSLLVVIAIGCKKEVTTTTQTTTETTTKTTADTLTTAADTAATQEVDQATMEKAWEENATPGAVHKVLASGAGFWNATMKFWMDPAKEPETYKSTAEIKMTLDGKFQEARYKGSVMNMPFEGLCTMGFDNAAQKVTSIWIDNSSTSLMYMTGDYDDATKTFNLSGTMTDPVNKKPKDYREKYTIVSNNIHKMEMFDTAADGSEYKSMEITLKRK